MPLNSPKAPTKESQKIHLPKARRSQIVSGLKVTSAEKKHAQKAVESAKGIHASYRSKPRKALKASKGVGIKLHGMK